MWEKTRLSCGEHRVRLGGQKPLAHGRGLASNRFSRQDGVKTLEFEDELNIEHPSRRFCISTLDVGR